MPGLYRDEGVVLRAIKLGEADRIVTIFTQGHGKIRAVAKGIRKTTSKFGARLEPTTRVALQCYKGRDLDIVTQAETLESNRVLREEYALLTRAIPMLEAVDQVAQDREANPALYRMLTGALRALATTRNPLVTPAFFWKLLSLEGFHPYLDACVRCEGEGPFTAIDLGDGGVLCATCGRLGGMRVAPEALELLGRLVGGELNQAIANPPAHEHVHEVERLGVLALEYHSERRIRSASLL